MPSPTIAALLQEIIDRVELAPSFTDNSYSIFNMEEIGERLTIQGFPLAAVSYEGADNRGSGIDNTKNCSASVVTLHYSIVIAVEYASISPDDSKQVATDLLDEIRGVVLGFKGINTRSWRFAGESPVDSEIEGVIFYSQLWETDITVISKP